MPIVKDFFGNEMHLTGTQEDVDHYNNVMTARIDITKKFLASKGYDIASKEDMAKIPMELIIEARNQPGWKEAAEGRDMTVDVRGGFVGKF